MLKISKLPSRKLFTALILFFCCFARAAYYPSNGDLYYNGQYYLDSYFIWNSPGPWSVNKPGYEHDLHVKDPSFFTTSCITMTNLPDGYDDCPTAGVFDSNVPFLVLALLTPRELLQERFILGLGIFPDMARRIRVHLHSLARKIKISVLGCRRSGACFLLKPVHYIVAGI